MLRAAADATWFSENNDKCHVGYRTKSQNSVCGRSECEPCPQILKLNIFVRSFFLVRRTYVQVTYLLCFLLPFRVFNVISAITNGDLHLTFWRSKSSRTIARRGDTRPLRRQIVLHYKSPTGLDPSNAARNQLITSRLIVVQTDVVANRRTQSTYIAEEPKGVSVTKLTLFAYSQHLPRTIFPAQWFFREQLSPFHATSENRPL